MLFIGGLSAYLSTLAPTVLDGDAALFQYTPSVLGVTYPTGYPTYILLGRLWTMLVPIGSVAYRMNLFSAVCGALALAFLYPAARRLLENRLAAFLAVLIFATLPTYWRWATEAKIYTLHILLLSGMLFLMTRSSQDDNEATGQVRSLPVGRGNAVTRQQAMWPAAVLFGLALGNHSTTLLLAPGLFLFFWLNCRPANLASHPAPTHSPSTQYAVRSTFYASRFTFYVLRFTFYILPLLILPLLLYLYVPLRAEWLLAREGTLPGLTVPAAVSRGLVADFYRPGLMGLLRYFTAADFTGGVVTNWGQVPGQLITVYWPLVRNDFTPWGAALALIGAITFAVWRPRRFWPLFLIYAALVPFVLTYGQGEQSAFLLPSSLMLAIFAGAAVAAGWRGIQRLSVQRRSDQRHSFSATGSQSPSIQSSNLPIFQPSPAREAQPGRASHPATPCEPSNLPIFQPSILPIFLVRIALVALVAWLPFRQAQANGQWLTDKWNDAAYQYWTDVLSHPMEPGAGMLAHWGDLTSFWYLQHAEGVRPDLLGLYPPTEEVVVQWLAAGHALYIAGPLQGWADGVEARYQLLPWGRLVRLAAWNADAQALLPDMDPAPGDASFAGQVKLLGVKFDRETASGGLLPVTLAWQTATGPLPADVHVSLRLVDHAGTRVAQRDEAMVSGWLPADSLPAGQVLLSFHRFELPAGTLSGDYRLQVSLFQPHEGDLSLENGQPALELGRIRIVASDVSQPVDPWGEYKPLPGVSFGGELHLVGYDYSVTRAGQGKGFAARFLWQALRAPSADYTLLVELVDAQGKVWRDWRHAPANGRAPTSTWAAGQTVRDEVGLVLPAAAPAGEDALRVRLSWLRPGGARLAVSRWIVPVGESFTLPGVRVVEKEGRRFDPPPIPYAANANYDDKVRLLGYDLSATRLAAGDSLSLNLIWQSLTSDMRESYTVFVHLVGPDGTIYGQWDKEPGERSKQPTTSWVEGEVVVDPISVPLSPAAPPGSYRVMVGMYLAPDGPRLALRDGTGAIIGDALELTRIQVVE